MVRAIDLFAGAGGFTTGAEEAGARVVWAANHWRAAVDVHERHHPHVLHSCQDLQQADWSTVPDHDLLLASPACQGHSPAGQPGRKRQRVVLSQQADRNTAWAVVNCAEVKRPRTILVENVPWFLRWPLLPAWEHALQLLGYHVTRHVFDCADFGTPQNRRRVVITARQDEALQLANPELPHQAFGPLVQWGSGNWRAVSSSTPGVRSRVRAARERGLSGRFLTHHVTRHRGREYARPIGCVTTKAQWAPVDERNRLRMLTNTELCRSMDLADDYLDGLTGELATRMAGNAIPRRFARELVTQAVAS